MRRLKLNKKDLTSLVTDVVQKLISGQKSVSISAASLLKMESPKPEDKPTIIISQTAYNKSKTLVEVCDKEVAWHGVVTQLNPMSYIIEDILVYPQEATAATVDSDDDLYPLWLDELDDNTFNNLRMQGHSHVNMGTSPSGPDDDFYSTLIKHIKDYYIFIIMNKSGSMWINLYDIKNSVVYETADIDLQIEGPNFLAWAKEQLKEYVSTKSYHEYTPTTTTHTTKHKGAVPRSKRNDYIDKEWQDYIKQLRGEGY